jgi:hypothetical protein
MPLAAKTKKPSCVSHSTPEAEIVSINLAMRTLGIPALNILDMVLDREAGVGVIEDNDATMLTTTTRTMMMIMTTTTMSRRRRLDDAEDSTTTQ